MFKFMQGVRTEVHMRCKPPYGRIIGIRFFGYDLNRRLAGTPACYMYRKGNNFLTKI